jgi:indole-3-glycerol phosphate synthase
MNTLEKIIADKYLEVEARKQQRPVAVLEKSSAFSRTPLSLKSFLEWTQNNQVDLDPQ